MAYWLASKPKVPGFKSRLFKTAPGFSDLYSLSVNVVLSLNHKKKFSDVDSKKQLIYKHYNEKLILYTGVQGILFRRLSNYVKWSNLYLPLAIRIALNPKKLEKFRKWGSLPRSVGSLRNHIRQLNDRLVAMFTVVAVTYCAVTTNTRPGNGM